MELAASSIIAGIITLFYFGLLAIVWRNRHKIGSETLPWLTSVVIFATLASGVSIVSSNSGDFVEGHLTKLRWSSTFLSFMLVAYTVLTLIFFLKSAELP